MAGRQVLATVLPAAAQFGQLLSAAQGFFGAPEHGVQALRVLPTILEAHAHDYWYHGIFILHRLVAHHMDFGCQCVYLWSGQGRALKVSDKDVALQEGLGQDDRNTESLAN
jgi:hypothetical protein